MFSPFKIPILYRLLTILLVFGYPYFVNSTSTFREKAMGRVICANVLFRHGDRTPIDPYPNDPYRNNSFWPVGFGQLTNTGKEQEYELGQWLRKRYDSLLGDRYDPDLVHVQSTDVDRTLMSAAANLAGLFPPTAAQRWNSKLDWQPIPIHTIPEALDKIVAAKAPCPAYEEELIRVSNSREIKDLNKKYCEVYRILSENTGKNVTKLQDVQNIYNTLYIENLYNFTLPEWTKGIFPNPLEDISKYSFALPTWTAKLGRLKSGLLIQDMTRHMTHKEEDNKHKPRQKLWIYSAHDLTVADLLNTLGVFDLQNPGYASTVLMELREDSSGNRQVTLFYRNSTTHEPYLLTVPGCTPVCPLDKFLSHCATLIPDDWDRECRASSLLGSYNTLTIAALLISSLLILVLVASVMLYWQRRRRPTHWYRKLKTDNL